MHDDTSLPPETSLPAEARCLTCGYFLRGLPEPICPECARGFDPRDATTFEIWSPRQMRAIWIKRGAVALVVLIVLLVFTPRRLLNGTMKFTCTSCGVVRTVRRLEPQPARWIPVRYPGISWTSAASGKNPPDTKTCSRHNDDVGVRFDLSIGGWCTGRGNFLAGQNVTFNGETATPETAKLVLTSLMRPSNNGIAVGSAATERE